MEGIELAALRQKSLALTELFIARVAALLQMDIVTPPRAALRVATRYRSRSTKSYAVVQAMIERGVIGISGHHDIMRFLRFALPSVQDVWDAADIADCVRAEVWRSAISTVSLPSLRA